MKVEFVNPILQAVVHVLKTMTFTNPKPGKPFLAKSGDPCHGDVTGVIGLTGHVNGSLTLSFSESAILFIVSNMFGEACKELGEEVQDAVGELSNMICGDARRALAEKGFPFEGAIPTVITGKKHRIRHTIAGPSIVIPFSVDEHGSFFVELCFEDDPM